MSLTRTAGIGLLCLGAWAGGAIHLKSRTIDTSRESFRLQAPLKDRYLLVQFSRYPGEPTRAELVRRGFRILNYVPDSALLLRAPDAPDLQNLGVTWAGPLAPADKLSKTLDAETSGVFLVTFHPGVDRAESRAIVRRHRFVVQEVEGVLPGHLLVSGNHRDLAALAAHEEVSYIVLAGPELFTGKRVYGCPGPISEAGPIADYVLADSGWPKDAQGRVALQYIFDSMTRKLDSNVARSQVERAFSEWARYANVTFTPGQQMGAARSIDILFATGAHGDAYPFTNLTTLAHTFYPAPPNPEPVAGDLHLNDSETWGVGNSIDLFSVALHEAGHALGLAHSDVPSAVMYPYYKLAGGLTSDDIAAVQKLYGAAGAAPVAPPVTPPVVTPVPPVPPVTPTLPGSDTVPPMLNILSPGYTIVSTSAASIAVSGTASDNVEVTAVKWTTSMGGSGTASGTTGWTATIPLLVGTNAIIIRAYDAAGNSSWRSLTAVRN